MKKTKELLLFIALLVMPIILFFIVSGFSADLISNTPKFVGIINYIRLFLNDKTFVKALFNTVAMPIAISFFIVSVFALVMFFVRKKIKAPRLIFYSGGVIIGAITSIICMMCISIATFGEISQSYEAQTIVSHIVDYKPSVFDAITLPNIFISLFVGIFTVFVFWIIELIIDIFKHYKSKGNL